MKFQIGFSGYNFLPLSLSKRESKGNYLSSGDVITANGFLIKLNEPLRQPAALLTRKHLET